MIDIKTISKPKNSGKTSGINSGGMAYAGMAVKEAAHAAKADVAVRAEEAAHADLAAQAEESAHAALADVATLSHEAEHAAEADHALDADNATMWAHKEFADYLDQSVRSGDVVTFGEMVTDTVRGVCGFVDGLAGEGFRLWRDENGLASLTLDKLTVRQTMLVLELLIEKVRSVGGQLCVSPASGKVKAVEDLNDAWRLTFEQQNLFVEGDLMRCATWSGGDMRGYWVEVALADDEGVVVLKDEFGATEPMVGDDCVLMGNTRKKNRQNMILVSATEDGQPRIDVMDGVKQKNFEGCLRARLGSLDGIEDNQFSSDKQPHGYGIYSDNAFFKGTFVLSSGEDVKTRFEITDAKIDSVVEGLRQDFMDDKGYLSNATFYHGMEKWDTQNEAVFFLVGNRWIWANKNVLTKKGQCAGVTKDYGRNVVMIRGKYICQKNTNLRDKPAFGMNGDGLKEPVPVYLSFFYRCSKAGTLRIGFENVNKSGFAVHDPLCIEEEIEVTEGYRQYTCSGVWNGTGDFRLEFTGEIYLYMLVLSTDKVEALTYKYKTLFEQSERLIKLSAAVFDKDAQALRETGIMVKPEGSGIYMQTADGKLALIGVGVEKDGKTVVKLTSDNIQLEGLVTANGNFRILEDGSIEARNAGLSGVFSSDDEINGNSVVINAKDGSITLFGPASVDDDTRLPTNDERVRYFSVDYCVDPDSLTPGAVMELSYGSGAGASRFSVDPLFGTIDMFSNGSSINISTQGIRIDNDYAGSIDIGLNGIFIEDRMGHRLNLPVK